MPIFFVQTLPLGWLLARIIRLGSASPCCPCWENNILGNEAWLQAFEDALTRSTGTPLKKKNKKRLISGLDSTEDPAQGKQDWVAFNGHFAKNWFHPLFGSISERDCLRAMLRPGNVHSADGTLPLHYLGGPLPSLVSALLAA